MPRNVKHFVEMREYARTHLPEGYEQVININDLTHDGDKIFVEQKFCNRGTGIEVNGGWWEWRDLHKNLVGCPASDFLCVSRVKAV